MNRPSWVQRIRRAELLAGEHQASAEILRFYAQIARFQEMVHEKLKRQPADTLRPECVEANRPELIRLVKRFGPAGLADKAAETAESAFFSRVLLQPYMECVMNGDGAAGQDCPSRCPACGDLPLAAVLRGEGDGGKRWLLCSLCSTEWEFRRVLCPACGEEDKDRLPVYKTDAFPHVRVEACDRCHCYVKAVDLTKNGLAIPCVDELAGLALDLWAQEAGYTKMQRNILLL